MKVYIICKEPFPFGMAGTQRIQCYAKAILSEGLDCEVLIYSRQEKGKIRRNMLSEGIFEGIPFKYVGGNTRKPSHKISRKFIEWYDKKALRFYLRKNLSNGDVVIAYVNSDTDYLCNIIDIVHSKGAKYVRELNEIPFFGGQSKSERKGLEKILNQLFPKCDGFITIADTLTKLAEQHCNHNAKIIKLPILVDFEKACVPDKSQEAGIPFIFHSGTLYERKDGIIGMINAFSMMKEKLCKPINLILTGDLETSPDKDSIIKTISENHLENDVKFVGYMKQDEINHYMSRASFAVMNKPDNIQNNYSFSTKIAGYLAAGKTLIISDVGEAMNWLKNGENALIVPKNDINALASAIVYAYNNQDECRRIGLNGRKLCKRCFDWRCVSKTLKDFLKDISAK